MSTWEYTVIGDTIKVATFLQQEAAPGAILVSESTYQRARPLFEFRALPEVVADEQGRPPIFEVTGIRRRPVQVRGLPELQVAMIGRDEALIQLRNSLDAAFVNGREQVVLVTGEAGVGKSRLILEFQKYLTHSRPGHQVAVYAGYCQAHTHSRPYWVIADILRHMTGIAESDSPTAQLERLKAYLELLNLQQDDMLPFLAYLLGVSHAAPEIEAQLQLFDADMLQRSIHSAIRQIFLTEAQQVTTILIFEDLHWVDDASWHFFRHFVRSDDAVPLLLILVSRDPRLENLSQLVTTYTKIQLPTLSLQEGQLLVDQLIQQQTETAQVVKADIVQRAAGNPFYIEEIVRMLIDKQGIVVENGGWHVTEQAPTLLQRVPGTIQALILARFDNLDPAIQHALQKASVLGISFPIYLLKALDDVSSEFVAGYLQQLVLLQFLKRDPSKGVESYSFRHALIQSAIYDTLLKRTRQKLHSQTAEAIERNPSWPLPEREEMLAHHFSRSRDPARAIPHLITVAENATRRYANESAVQYYQQAVTLIEQQDQGLSEAYFRARIGMGQTLKLLGKYSEAKNLLTEALQALLRWSMQAKPLSLLRVMVDGLRELADIHMRESDYDTAVDYLEAGIEALGEAGAERHPQLYRSLIERIVVVRFRQGALDDAFDLAQIALSIRLPDKNQDPVTLANLYNTLGGIAWQQGNLENAIQYVEQSLKLYETLNYTWGTANAYSNLGVLNAQQGDWQQTIAYWEQSLALRNQIGDVQNQIVSLLNLGQLRLSMGQHTVAQENLKQALSIAQKLGDTSGIAGANIILARVKLIQEHLDEALAHVNTALMLVEEIGRQDVQIEGRWIEALIQADKNNPQLALETATQALQTAKEAGLVGSEADCLRVLGAIYRRTGKHMLAETHLRESVELCRQMKDPYRQGLALLELGVLYQLLVQSDAGAQTDWYIRAQNALNRAVEFFDRLGADHDRQRAQEMLAELAAQLPTMAQSGASSLPADSSVGERRTAAILWLNLELPADGDEEAVFEVMTYILPACATIAQEYHGYVRQRSNGLTAVFGVPATHEDDMERAVRAAYHIRQYWRMSENQLDLPVILRIAVSQGPVVAGEAIYAHDFIVTGAPVDQAQQLAAAVPPDHVWVTEAVRSATERLFIYQPAPQPGAADTLLWQLVDLRDEPEPARGVPGIQTRFIGRDASLQAMLDLSHNLEQNIGGIIWIEGEAGIGKSRLMREFRSAFAIPDSLIWTGSCSPQRINHAFSLFSDLLSGVFNLNPTDSREQIRQKIDQTVLTWPADAQTTKPYLEMLAGIRPQGVAGERLTRLEPEQLRQQTFVAMRRLLKTLAKEHPLVLLLDDLHWIDLISAEQLIFIVTIVTSAPILFVCAQRREGSDSPNDRLVRMQSLLQGQTLQLFLDRLSPELSAVLIADLLPGAALPERLQTTIITRSEGNPYFIEEFVRMFIERAYVEPVGDQWRIAADANLGEMVVPSSLDTLIRSRIDALPEELKQTLQCAAIFGQEFETELLDAITDVPNVRLSVERLVSRLMLRPSLEPGRWQFSHTLFETIVYNTMLKTWRQALHLSAARALESRWAESASDHAKELAFHYGRAGEDAKVLPYLIIAGEQAAAQHADEEALIHFQKAAEILPRIPAPDEQWQWRIAVGLGDVYRFIGQFTESKAALESALTLHNTGELRRDRHAALYRRLGDTAQKQGDLETARRNFSLALDMLIEPDDPLLQLEAARTLIGLGWVHFAQGQFDDARQACEDGLAQAQAADNLNEQATAHNLLGGIYYHLGVWRDAFHHTTRAMVLREQMGYSWGVAATLSNLGILAFVAGHWPKAISFFERSLALRQEMGDVEGLTVTRNNLGNAYRGQGKPAEAEHHLRESVKTAETFNYFYHIANSSVSLAHVVLWQGRVEEAESILTIGLNQAEEIGAQDVLAEAHRVRAELLLAHEGYDDALAAARQAAALAATVGNPSFEAAAWRVASEAALRLDDLAQAEKLIDDARQALTGATDELETGRVAAQAYRIHRRMGHAEQAETDLLTAREIFNRLGAHYFLDQLEEGEISPI